MAEAARHVNTMEAHHAPNWSRKHHVDGAHDKPSATSGGAYPLLPLCVGFGYASANLV